MYDEKLADQSEAVVEIYREEGVSKELKEGAAVQTAIFLNTACLSYLTREQHQRRCRRNAR
jgi:hypothetical protein